MKYEFKKAHEIDIKNTNDFVAIKKENIKKVSVVFRHKLSKMKNPLKEQVRITYDENGKTKTLVTPWSVSRQFYNKAKFADEKFLSKYSRNNENVLDVEKINQYMEQMEHKGNQNVQYATMEIELKPIPYDISFYAPQQFIDNLDESERKYEKNTQDYFQEKDDFYLKQWSVNKKLQAQMLAGEVALDTAKLEQTMEKIKEAKEHLSKQQQIQVKDLKLVGEFDFDKLKRNIYIIRKHKELEIPLPSVEFKHKWSKQSLSNIKGPMVIINTNIKESFDYLRRNDYYLLKSKDEMER